MYNDRLSIKNLKTDMSYQSPVKEAQVKKIVKAFDPNKLHTIVVNRRMNGLFYVIDGQHRVEALKRLGILWVEATIHNGLTIEQEAEMYYGINDRPTKSPNSKGKAELMFNDPIAIEIDKAVRNAGLQVDYDRQNHSYGFITAYQALKTVNKKHGPEHLELVLTLIREAFGNDSRHFQGYVIQGFSKFVETYIGNFKTTDLINRLKKIGFDGLLSEISKNKAGFSSKKECLPFTLADIYNKGLRKDNKLNTRFLLV